MADIDLEQPPVEEPFQDGTIGFEQPGEAAPSETVDDPNVAILDVPVELSEQDKKTIAHYLNENLPKMGCPQEEKNRIRQYLDMYEMVARKRNFPYENAPSLASSDAHSKLNEILDQAETAFLQQRVTFSLDREDMTLTEADARRVERTLHKKFFIESGLMSDLRTILFEAIYLPACVLRVRPEYRISVDRGRIVLKTFRDIEENRLRLKSEDIRKGMKAVERGDLHIAKTEELLIENAGPKISRVDLTKFLYPRNAKRVEEWQIMGEVEYYTASALEQMADIGEVDKKAVDEILASRREKRERLMRAKDGGDVRALTEAPKPHALETDWASDYDNMKLLGDAYEDEFTCYRVAMLYRVPSERDPSGNLRSWIEVLYCPEKEQVLGAVFLKRPPYRIVQYRPVSYKAFGVGVAQQRYATNALDSDLKSLGLASVEQEVGAPLMIRKNSGLWASNFRAYPSSVTYTEDVNQDARFLPYPEKSRIATQGMAMVLGSSPASNQGAAYASGKREEILMQRRQTTIKARLFSIALDLDFVWNDAWQILCDMARLNTEKRKLIPWVYAGDIGPIGKRLYVLEKEMNPQLLWSSVVSAVSMSPDSRLQKAMQMMQVFHDKQAVAVNNPRLTIAWLNWLADYWDGFTEDMKQNLLPNQADFKALQQQNGMQGGEREGVSPAVAQSPATPFRQPNAER